MFSEVANCKAALHHKQRVNCSSQCICSSSRAGTDAGDAQGQRLHSNATGAQLMGMMGIQHGIASGDDKPIALTLASQFTCLNISGC